MKNACPNEEMMADYLENRLSEIERLDVESHLSECDDCLEWVSVTHSMMHDFEGYNFRDVPEMVTQSAIWLTFKKPNPVVISMKAQWKKFMQKIQNVIEDMGMIFWTEIQVAPVRGSRVVLARNQSRRRKDFEKIKTDIEIEKTGDNQAQIRVMVKKDLFDEKIRVILLKRRLGVAPILDREVASYIIEDDAVLFENIPFDHYKLTFTKNGVTLGRYLFQIK